MDRRACRPCAPRTTRCSPCGSARAGTVSGVATGNTRLSQGQQTILTAAGGVALARPGTGGTGAWVETSAGGLSSLSGITGVTYSRVLLTAVSPTNPTGGAVDTALKTIESWLDYGVQVPIVIGASIGATTHYVVVLAREGPAVPHPRPLERRDRAGDARAVHVEHAVAAATRRPPFPRRLQPPPSLPPDAGVWTDDELAALELRAELAGRVRGEAQGRPTVAAAVQLERAGVDPEDVEFELLRLSNEVDGIPMTDVDVAPESSARSWTPPARAAPMRPRCATGF